MQITPQIQHTAFFITEDQKVVLGMPYGALDMESARGVLQPGQLSIMDEETERVYMNPPENAAHLISEQGLVTVVIGGPNGIDFYDLEVESQYN